MLAGLASFSHNSLNIAKASTQDIIRAVTNLEDGYEQYLDPYDVVSLNDLGLNSVEFHGEQSKRAYDLNTNASDKSVNNIFANSKDNEKGNVEFVCKYYSDAVPVAGGNVSIVLRGIAYYGYKFTLGTDSKGLFAERLTVDGVGSWLGGTEKTFQEDKEYIVAVGAIDITGLNKTQMYVKVDGTFVFNKVVDSIDFCVNPRVSLGPNGNYDENNNYTGNINIYDAGDEIIRPYSTYTGRFDVLNGDTSTIKATTGNNSIPFNNDHITHVTNKSNLTLVRNGVSTPIGDATKQILSKNSETDYSIYVSEFVDIQNDDQLVLEGVLSSYDSYTSTKSSFYVGKTTFVYSNNKWSTSVTLEDARNDAIEVVRNYVDLSLYDDEDALAIEQIIELYVARLESASSLEEVETILENAKSEIASYRTTFRKYQDNAISVVTNYKDDVLMDYREDEIEEMDYLKADAINQIEEATTTEEIDQIVETVLREIDALMTNAEYEVEELKDAITLGVEEIQNYYAKLDVNNMSEEERSTLNADTLKAIDDIKNAKSIDEVENIIEAYKNAHPIKEEEKPEENKGGCGGSIIATSALLSLISLMGVSMLVLRKKKTN